MCGAREILLVGFKTENVANCSDFRNGMPSSELSEPFVLARQTLNVTGASMDVNLTPSSMTAKVTDCNFASDNGGAGAYFGSGSDGDLTDPSVFQSVHAFNAGSQHYSAMGTVDSIVNLNNGTAAITVQDGWNASTESHVRVGNEMMLYVLGGNEGTPNGCGNLWPGFSYSGMVTSVQTGDPAGNTFNMSIGDSRWLQIPAANLTASATGTGGHTFCRVVAIRVPHFNNVTITSSAHQMRVASAAYADMTVANHISLGILPMRIKGTLSIGASGGLTIQTDQGGYRGGTSGSEPRGQGHAGHANTAWTSTLNPYSSGGGYGSGGGCGGGHGGVGGCGVAGSGGNIAGDEYGCQTLDPTKSCLRGKFFLGGGGGTDSSGGGRGGGAIRLFAKNVVADGMLTLSANGGGGMGLDDGGGAGGSIMAVFETLSGGGMFNVDVEGGPGNALGGAGGGGRAHIVVKSNSFAGTGDVSRVYGSGGVVSGAGHGTCKVEGLPAAFCPAPPP
jgi:hypothetical protein